MTEATTWNQAPVTLDELPMFAVPTFEGSLGPRNATWTNDPPRFGGSTYDADQDEARLTGQLGAVFGIMKDGEWRTLSRIAELIWSKTGALASEASISARLRDLRKVKFGGHKVERRRRSAGLWEYRVEVNHG